MWHSSGSYNRLAENFLKYKIPTMDGQSGSPIIKKNGEEHLIIGIHIGSDPKCEKNIAVLLTS